MKDNPNPGEIETSNANQHSSLPLPIPRRKKHWFQSPLVPICISVASLGISLWAVLDANKSTEIAQNALDISRKTSKLGLRPELRLDDYMGVNRPPYLALYNAGPVPAVHVTVQIFSLGYDPKKKDVVIGMSEEPPNFYFPSIQPNRYTQMPLDRRTLSERFVMSYSDAPKMQEPYFNDLLEVRVRYYREVDSAAFGGRNFFFRTPEGDWARENQSSFPREVLAAALRWPSTNDPPFFKLNPLNE